MPDALAEHLRGIALIDHHVHGNFDKPVDRATFEAAINEGSTDPVPAFMTQFDSPLGLSIRRWCAPLLGLDALASPDEYWARRSEFSPDELAEAMLPAAKVSRWIVDTGFKGDLITTHERLAELSGGRSSEILRLERLAEDLLENGTRPDDFPDALRSALAEAADSPDVVGTKTIVAYRTGFDIDWTAARRRRRRRARARTDDRPRPLRVDSTVLIAFAVHEAALHGLPLQVHVGFGDRDLDLHRTDPMLLLPLLRTMPPVPVLLLHCYPFQRQARLSGAGVRSRELRCGTCDQLPRCPFDRADRRGTRNSAVRQTAVLLRRLRATGVARSRARCCGDAAWGLCSGSGCAPVTAPRKTPSGSST